MRLLTYMLVVLLLGCGTDNVSPQDGATDEQRAQKLMNAGDYGEAIAILEPVIVDEPENYKAFTLLAAAYAGRAGVTVLDIIESQLNASDDGGGGDESLFSTILNILPAGYDADDLSDVGSALTVLYRIPAANRGAEGDPEYGESAELQIVIYNAVYSTMLVGQFTNSLGEFDADSLADLGDDEATAVLAALQNMIDDGGGEDGLSGGAQSTLDDIDASQGDSDAERLRNYIEADG